MEMVKIELQAPECNMQSRTFPAKDDKPAVTRHFQIGWMWNGSRFPVQVQIPLEDGQPPYAPGDYSIHVSNFRANRFQKIELDPFKLILVPYVDKQSKQ
ncbi:single-stranded DNA-binding protein [Shewanella algae]|uniref:single-stranded DNA-binding protein n=1 Tax=Shewanella algae TaxID=38313 RepID=UPI0031F53AE5